MSQKKRINIVYSTNPEFKYQEDEEETISTLPPKEQDLRVFLEKNNRGGKTVSIVRNFVGNETDLEILGKEIKSKCGTGGSIKEGEILIQGDFRDKIVSFLLTKGYKVKKAGG